MCAADNGRFSRQSDQGQLSAKVSAPAKPKLLDRLAQALRSRRYSQRTEQTHGHWVRRFIFFHHTRHPAEMGAPEINPFLTHLAVKEKQWWAANQRMTGHRNPA